MELKLNFAKLKKCLSRCGDRTMTSGRAGKKLEHGWHAFHAQEHVRTECRIEHIIVYCHRGSETKSDPNEILEKLGKSNMSGEWCGKRPLLDHTERPEKVEKPRAARVLGSVFGVEFISADILLGMACRRGSYWTNFVARFSVWRIYFSFQYGLLRELFDFILYHSYCGFLCCIVFQWPVIGAPSLRISQ